MMVASPFPPPPLPIPTTAAACRLPVAQPRLSCGAGGHRWGGGEGQPQIKEAEDQKGLNFGGGLITRRQIALQ
jgi:hypothetical protein